MHKMTRDETPLQKRSKTESGRVLQPIFHIPEHVLEHPELFDGAFPEEFLQFITMGEDKLLDKIIEMFDDSDGEEGEDEEEQEQIADDVRSKKNEAARVRQKTNLWLAIAISHPNMGQAKLGAIGWHLNLPQQALFKATIIWGSLPHILYQVQHYKQGKLQSLPLKHLSLMLLTSAEHGHINVLKHLHAELSHEQFCYIFKESVGGYAPYAVYQFAMAKGNLPFIQALEACLPEHIKEMRTCGDNLPFQLAVGHGSSEALAYLTGTLSEEQIQEQIRSRDFASYLYSVDNNCLEGVRYLEKHVEPKDLEKMIGATDHAAFRNAVSHSHHAMVEHLLSNLCVLKYAEAKAPLYDKYLNVTITQKIASLFAVHEEKENEPGHLKKSKVMQSSLSNSDALNAQCYYQMLHTLIRRNKPSLQKDITFLLEMPHVRAHVTQPNNSLLRLACAVNNSFAIKLLTGIASAQQTDNTTNRKRPQALGELACDHASRLSKYPNRFMCGKKAVLPPKTTSPSRPVFQSVIPAHMLQNKNFFPEKIVPKEFLPFMQETNETELFEQLKDFAFVIEHKDVLRDMLAGGSSPKDFKMPENFMSSKNKKLLDVLTISNIPYFKASLCICIAISHPSMQPSKLQSIVTKLNLPQEYFFYAAILWGNATLIQVLVEQYQREGTLESLVEANKCEAWVLASMNNREDLLRHLEQALSGTSQKILANHNALLVAAANEQLPLVRICLAKVDSDKKQEFLERVYRILADKKCVAGMHVLESAVNPQELQVMIKGNNFALFKNACTFKNTPLIEHWLTHVSVLSYAVQNAPLYDVYLNPFISKKMIEFRSKDLSSSRMTLPDSEYLYEITQYFIRLNKSGYSDLTFLLQFPSIQAIAAQNDNHLLRMSMLINNTRAVRLLASLPVVKDAALTQNLDVDMWLSAQTPSMDEGGTRNRFIGKTTNSEMEELSHALEALLSEDNAENDNHSLGNGSFEYKQDFNF